MPNQQFWIYVLYYKRLINKHDTWTTTVHYSTVSQLGSVMFTPTIVTIINVLVVMSINDACMTSNQQDTAAHIKQIYLKIQHKCNKTENSQQVL